MVVFVLKLGLLAVKLATVWYTFMVADGKITKYILDNDDNKNYLGKPPYWISVGFFFSAVAFIIGSIKFIIVSFLIGCIIGALFGNKKSIILWKHCPYWLRGGIVGGGIALIYAILLISCVYTVSDYGVFGCMGLFELWGPAYPVGLAMAYFQPIFNYSWIWAEGYSFLVAIPVGFISGALLGALGGAFWVLIKYIKSRKNKPSI